MLTAQPDEPDYSGEPVTLSLKDADLNDVLSTFAKISGYEILVEPGITGKVTTTVDQVPWDGALVSIVQDQGLEWERNGNQIIIRKAGAEKRAPAKPVRAVRRSADSDRRPLTGKLEATTVFTGMSRAVGSSRRRRSRSCRRSTRPRCASGNQRRWSSRNS